MITIPKISVAYLGQQGIRHEAHEEFAEKHLQIQISLISALSIVFAISSHIMYQYRPDISCEQRTAFYRTVYSMKYVILWANYKMGLASEINFSMQT